MSTHMPLLRSLAERSALIYKYDVPTALSQVGRGNEGKKTSRVNCCFVDSRYSVVPTHFAACYSPERDRRECFACAQQVSFRRSPGGSWDRREGRGNRGPLHRRSV